MNVIIDGRPIDPQEALVSVTDWGFLRGDGIFEAIRSYGGQPFQLDAHLDRLQRSAAMVQLALPPPEQIAEWARQIAGAGGDCVVRILVTQGDPDAGDSNRVIVLSDPVPDLPEALSLRPTAAPWHSGGSNWELTGAKTLSYAPNMSAWRAAQQEGFDDALLISREGIVLEGPTFSVAWVLDGIVETPSLDLGILASVTRRVMIEEASKLGITVQEGRFPLERVIGADEVFVLSTVKTVKPVGRVGETVYGIGPVTKELNDAYMSRVTAETC